MRRVALESPHAGDAGSVAEYARAALADSLGRGEAPFVGHLLYSHVLGVGRELQSMLAAVSWASAAEALVVYEDLGVSEGMHQTIRAVQMMGLPVEYRRIGWRPASADQEKA